MDGVGRRVWGESDAAELMLVRHCIRMADEECDRLRALLRLSSEPGVPDGRQDAGVLILLDGTPDEYRVFLCIRSEELRRHPGEVCFPGGMRDGGENMQETAMREAEEFGLYVKDSKSQDLVIHGLDALFELPKKNVQKAKDGHSGRPYGNWSWDDQNLEGLRLVITRIYSKV
ncbi:hydrolase, NUDIX family [Ancylostoma ceylanicum]|uniref:Hydrolase, NUDIX family n=1 Tax=Ancylostoma ceylanicum TaxID=53326 RepID=A0A0D6MA93_9BILA|nr:hydrolase, NUDIX family [Ancylostoma ceylanicum]